MTDDQAIQPTTISGFFPRIKNDQDQVIQELYKDDENWSLIGEGPAYRLLKGYIEGPIQGLDDMEGQAFENGASLEEIGLRRAVNRLTAANLRSIITKVEQTTDAVQKKRKSGGGAR